MLVDLWNVLVATGFTALLILVCVILVLMSPSIDPAVRWKEHNERRKRGKW